MSIPTAFLIPHLRRLERLGDPLRIVELGSDMCALYLRTDGKSETETELKVTEKLDWYDTWQIIGALVSRTQERGELKHRDALLEAAKDGLETVLAVRVGQLRQRLEA